MTVPRLTVSAQPAIESDVDVLIVGVLQTDAAPVLHADPAFSGLTALLASVGVTGARDEVVRLAPTVGGARGIAVVGLGKEITLDGLRNAAGAAVRQITGVGSVAFAFPLATEDEVYAVLEGAALGAYSFTTFRQSSLASTKLPAGEITVHTTLAVGDAVERVGIVAGAVSLVKDLVNTPPSHLYPESLARKSIEAAAGLSVDVRVWDEEELVADGFGGIAGVGQGSSRPPRLVKVSYMPDGAIRHLALVGKGITGRDSRGRQARAPGAHHGVAVHRREHAVRHGDPPE
jgi:leucyl aminopeptidase